MIETWTPAKGVFSLVRVDGTNNILMVPLHVENARKREVLKLRKDEPPRDEMLFPLASTSLEMPGGKADGDEDLARALQRELLEEVAEFFRAVSHLPMSELSLREELVCYQVRGEKRLAIDVYAFYLSILASNIQSLVDRNLARIVSLDDLSTIQSMVRPYQSAFLSMVHKGEICLPTQLH